MFLYHKWLETNINTRHKIADKFGFTRKGSIEVVDNTIKNDGYAIKDIEQALNIDALQAYLNTSETDMFTLWLWLIDEMEGRPRLQPNFDTTSVVETKPQDKEEQPKIVNKKKNA